MAAVALAEVAVAQAGKKGTKAITLDELVAQLTQALGANLVAVVLYGSAASDEHVAGYSDHNIMVIAESLTNDTLQRLGQTARAWQEAGNPPPLLLTRREWLGSSDVFPMEYADIIERHKVLVGGLPLDDVHVASSDLRLQVEQEALGKLLRLRRAVMMAGTDTARQRDVLRESMSAFLIIFRSVERLHGAVPARDALQVVESVALRCGFAAQPFLDVVALVRGHTLSDSNIKSVLPGYVAGAESLVAYLDRYTP